MVFKNGFGYGYKESNMIRFPADNEQTISVKKDESTGFEVSITCVKFSTDSMDGNCKRGKKLEAMLLWVCNAFASI